MIPSTLRKQRLIILALLILPLQPLYWNGARSASLSYDRLLPILMGKELLKRSLFYTL